MNKHTPGPWVFTADMHGTAEVMAGDVYIATPHYPNARETMEADLAANARLIAAAPELLELVESVALVRAFEAFKLQDSPASALEHYRRVADQCRSALAKFNGGAK